jgi:hypothetical protein
MATRRAIQILVQKAKFSSTRRAGNFRRETWACRNREAEAMQFDDRTD